MQRTKQPNDSKLIYPVDEEPIILSKPLLDTFLSQPNPANLIALYCFYYYTAKWQKTNQPKATNNYCMQGLGWGYQKLYRTQLQLIELKLIEKLNTRDASGKITGWYIKVNFIWKKDTVQNYQKQELANTRTGKQKTNALSTNKENALSTNNFIVASQFEKFWKLFPKKTDKGKALTKWNQLCSKKDKPTWREIKRAIRKQKQSERWQDIKFVPHPTTWLNQSRWLDDPEQMKSYDRDEKPDHEIYDGQRWNLQTDGKYRNEAGKLLMED